MSDVFNTTVNKQQISQLLFGKDPIDESITTESFLHPPQPNKTSSTGDSAERRAEFIINHRIPAFHPKLLSENVEIPYEELQLSGNFNKYVEALHESYQTRLSEGRTYPYKDPGILILPEGDKLVLPYYKPLYKNGRYDEKILNQVVFESLYNKIGEHDIKDGFILNRTRIVDTDHATMTVREVRAAAAEYILSTGTWKGQLSRLRAMHDVRHGLKGNFAPKTLAQLNLSLEDFSIILQDTLPIQPIEEDPDMLPLMYKPSQYIVVDGDEFIDTLPKLKIKSKAGPPFPSRLKKGDIYTSSIFMADYILTRISEEVKKPTGARDFSSILKEEPWLAMGFGFPKEERYRRDQLETKTRNIFSASTVTHLLNSMITDPIMSKSNYNLASKDSVTPSLQKFTPYFGNLTTFLNHMLDETRTTDAIYADNWYVSWLGNDGKKRYYSLDLIKGEAQATPDMAAAVGYYLLTRGWVTEDNYVAFSKTWAAYALKVMPACVVDSIFVWYNFQLRFPGQGSGNTFTYIINQATTSKFRYFWKKAGEPCPSLDGVTFTPEFTKVMEQTGVNWQIELYHRDLMQEVIDVATETPTEGFLQDDTPLSLDEHGQSTYGKRLPRLRLDILGYDAVYSNKLESFIPVLAWDRLLPSVLWPKKEEDDIKDPLVYRMYRLLRYEVLRFMGGFTDPILDQALGSIAAEIRKFFQERGLATAYDLEAFGEVDDLAPALLELFDTMGKQVRLDSNFYLSAEMISSLNTPKDTPNRLAKNPVPAHLRKLRVSLDTFSRGARTTRFQDLSVTIKRLSAELYSQKTITNLGDPKRLREMAVGLVNQNLKDRTGSASIVNALDGFEKIIDLVIEYSSEGAKKFDAEKEERLQRDVTLAYNELLDKVLKATRKSSEAIESLLMTDPQAQIYTDYLKNSAELANPTLGYSGAIGHARVPKPRLEGLTKSQKKNLKKRTKTRELKEKMAQ